MKAVCFAIVAWLLVFCYFGESMANQESKALGADDVIIGPNAISMPIGRILLVKKANSIWALQFIDYETKQGDGCYSRFICYKFNGVVFNETGKGMVSFLEPNFWHRILHIFQPNSLRYASGIKCEFELFAHAGWNVERATVYFGPGPGVGDPFIFLAPTPWKEVSEVIVSDPRIVWYQYDKDRGRDRVPIDKLWR